MQRTHLLRHDLDWLPPSYQALRWTVTGGVLSGLLAALVGTSLLGKFHVWLFWQGLAGTAASGYVVGDRAARRVLRRRLRRLAQGQIDLTRLAHEPDGELVHVRGRIQATETIRSLLSPRVGVFRRVLIECRTMRVVHEAAVDFRVTSGEGEPALVDVEGARLIAPDPTARDWFTTSCETVLALPLPDRARDYFLRWRSSHRRGRVVPPIRMAERLLSDGDAIEIVGYKSRSMDPLLVGRLPRDAPFRATLRAGRKLPLLIAPA